VNTLYDGICDEYKHLENDGYRHGGKTAAHAHALRQRISQPISGFSAVPMDIHIGCFQLFRNTYNIIFREEATSALTGFHASPLSWSNRNLEMLAFVKGGKPENPK